VSGWWSFQQQGCNGMCRSSKLCGGTMYSWVHLCTRSALGRAGSQKHRRRDRRALLSMWGTRTSEGTRGPARAQATEDRQVCGECRSLWQLKGHAALTLHLNVGTWQMFVC
jgi:hypothetical protein